MHICLPCNLQKCTSTKPRLFAVDTCLVLSHSSPTLPEKDCNQEMQNLNIWCNANKLQINPQKSSVLTIPFKSNSPSLDLNICYNDCLIACQNSCKYLGVSLDSKLHFQPHINQIEIIVAKAVGILSKLRFLFPKSALILLYYSLIHPHLLYALPLWGSSFPTYLSKLQRLQNKALRIISNSNQLTSATPLFHKLEILKITDLYQFEISKLMYLHSKKSLPHCFLDLFPPQQFIVEQQDPKHRTTSTLRNTQLFAVKGLSSFKVSKFGTLFPQTLEIYHLIDLRQV